MTNPYREDAPRGAIALEHTWNAESVFPTRQDWEAELQAVLAALPGLARFQGRLQESPQLLAEALELRDALGARAHRLVMFALISHEVDSNDPQAAAMAGQAFGMEGQYRAAAAFIEPELLQIGEAALAAWGQAEPRLAVYGYYLADLFRKQAHVRPAEVEELLGGLADPFSGPESVFGMLTNADLQFPPARDSAGQEHPVTQGSVHRLLNLPDRLLRRSAWESYHGEYLAHKNTLAAALSASIKQYAFTSRARRYASTLEMALDRPNLPTAVFENLIATFQKNLPTWHRYFALRRRVLGVEDLQPYDVWAPLAAAKTHVSFEQAIAWITAGLAPLGPEYVETIRRGTLEQRWVDIYPNQGKTAGAFSFGSWGTHPFIVMSFNDNVFSMSTLAHELGHSMHSYLDWQAQPFVYSNYSMFVAETASNFHQAMVRAYLLEHERDPNLQIELIEEALSNFHRYFLVMPTLARFELEMHQKVERGEGLTAETMIARMAELFAEAYGPAMTIDRDLVGITWATFGHLYTDYYVFQYATGISAAHALANRVLSGGPAAAEDYRRFLQAGGSLDPLDALKVAGVDMANPEAVEATFQVLANYVDRLERLL